MKNIKADVAVIALGAAGLAACAQAAELGVKVVAFEKAAVPGGAANMGTGPLAIESKFQKDHNVDLTKEKAFNMFMDYTHWEADARLVRDYFWKSADTLQWLIDMGVEFDKPAKFCLDSESTWIKVKRPDGKPSGAGGASFMNKRIFERAKELGAEVYLNTPVIKITRDDEKVTGLIAKGKDGEEIYVEAKAVIVATGGFGNNPDMIKEYTGYTYGVDMFNFRLPAITGDGLKMAWKVGAGKSKMTMEKNVAPTTPMSCSSIMISFMQPHLIVNLQGERFFNEECMQNGAVASNAFDRQENKCGFSICTQETIEYYKENGVDFTTEVFSVDISASFDEQVKKAVESSLESICVASSIEEIAKHFYMDADNFKKTIEEYNFYCDQNHDQLFNKNAKFLRPIRGNKLYAVRIAPSAYGSLGGIKINYKTEVITEDFKVIPGLYGAGNDVCDIYGSTYLYKIPGNSMGFALNTGRIAAENAVKYIKSSEGVEYSGK
ncbi:FAD-dependent oxidoreductase [Clostridium sp. P21]|uniref:FAD-dependent oxidoreductase n=1 Tax=Clostridium muellerianum TaxID=2716538 RepID=A0A7Y0EFV1_9CLOT|nr:FAD-binding protein [Clostridium muellerianum]NMM61690.1 FAD-dependent oxidoreductase [Clostridium muellerianum]